jgi:hypothetical protein
VRSDLFHADVQLLAHTGQLVGQEDVRCGGQLVENLKAIRRGEVESQAVLASIGMLQQRMHVARHDGQAGRSQAPHGIAALDVLDLDDLGPPIRQEGRGGGNERVLRHLEDPDAF